MKQNNKKTSDIYETDFYLWLKIQFYLFSKK
jgi:hypothetical protein